MRVLIVAAAVLLGGVSVAEARPHSGPQAIAPGLGPDQAAGLIAAACVDRGFDVRRPSASEVICQAGELNRREPVFRPSTPPEDPHVTPQVYHRFAAEAGPEGAVIVERTVTVVNIQGLKTFDAAGAARRAVDTRLREFYQALGFRVAD